MASAAEASGVRVCVYVRYIALHPLWHVAVKRHHVRDCVDGVEIGDTLVDYAMATLQDRDAAWYPQTQLRMPRTLFMPAHFLPSCVRTRMAMATARYELGRSPR